MLDNIEQAKEAATTAFKEGVEKLSANLGEAGAVSQANLDAIVASSQIVGKGFGEIAAVASQYAKGSFERSVEAAKAIGGAKSVQEALELQAEFTKTSVTTWLSEFNKISEIMVSTSKEAIKPVSDRTTDLISKIQPK